MSEWNGKPLSLQIHHINGDNCDNRLENLQVLCPNCHSQTDNFCRKYKKLKSTNEYCECDKTTVISHKHDVERPSFDELKTMIYTMSFVEIGKKYGVSDNCIRKWCKKCGLPHTKQAIRNSKFVCIK